jgi:hypothetical protein
MDTREQVLQALRDRQPVLRADFGVTRIGLFGSFAAGTQRPDSDVDLIVEFARPVGLGFVDLCDYLQHLLGRKVDVLTPAGLKSIRQERIAAEIARSIVYV